MSIKKMKWALLWALLIFILCAIPGHDIPHISFLEMLSFDKLVHAGLFFILATLSIQGLKGGPSAAVPTRTTRLVVCICCVVYGGLLEIMQGTLCVDRTADVFDFLANGFGASMACLGYAVIDKHILSRFQFLN
jgi:VanZ family protein